MTEVHHTDLFEEKLGLSVETEVPSELDSFVDSHSSQLVVMATGDHPLD